MLRYLWFVVYGADTVVLSVYRISEACPCVEEGIALPLVMSEAGEAPDKKNLAISGCGGMLLTLLSGHPNSRMLPTSLQGPPSVLLIDF